MTRAQLERIRNPQPDAETVEYWRRLATLQQRELDALVKVAGGSKGRKIEDAVKRARTAMATFPRLIEPVETVAA